jgi:hypothetical protein
VGPNCKFRPDDPPNILSFFGEVYEQLRLTDGIKKSADERLILPDADLLAMRA